MQPMALGANPAENRFAAPEARSAGGRAQVDWIVALWAASRLGMDLAEARRYAAEVIETGLRSLDGRGGFARIAADLSRTAVTVEEVRTIYQAALAEGLYGTA